MKLFIFSTQIKTNFLLVLLVTVHKQSVSAWLWFQIIQMKLILLCVWAEMAILGSTKTALKFKYEI